MSVRGAGKLAAGPDAEASPGRAPTALTVSALGGNLGQKSPRPHVARTHRDPESAVHQQGEVWLPAPGHTVILQVPTDDGSLRD